ncbi:hypothetical protein [Muribaculum gordoncarteri]|jgi:hypothetical protein|uniref:hypothetical protein n=1 Tax=Muribaculum gordoncarteri TaxID=2530390 RepID=UPI00248BCA46|nr:hypothetical protein [Muribaculum gordoncarteri]
MAKAEHDKSKKGSRRKKKAGQSKWRERAKSLGKNLLFAVLCAAVYLSADALMGRTILRGVNGDILNFVMILVMALPVVLLPIRSWIMGVRDWPSLLLNAFIGWLAGVGLFYLSIIVWLGTNYLIPRSEPYERKAVVYGMQAERRYRQAAHNYVNLRFTDSGEWYRYDADYDEYKSLQPGDTCIVTLRDGIWRYPAIRHLQPPEKSVSPQRDIKSLLNHLNERKTDRLYKALSGSENNLRYGKPICVKYVTAEDMADEFRVGLFNIATFEEIADSKRVFVECTWNLGHKDEYGEESRLTYWYEQRAGALYPVDSVYWDTGMDF